MSIKTPWWFYLALYYYIRMIITLFTDVDFFITTTNNHVNLHTDDDCWWNNTICAVDDIRVIFYLIRPITWIYLLMKRNVKRWFLCRLMMSSFQIGSAHKLGNNWKNKLILKSNRLQVSLSDEHKRLPKKRS